jgi:nitric oxide reductase NorD protein
VLKYFLEFEESIGKNWDKYITNKVHKTHEQSKVYFNDLSKQLIIFYHLLGGDQAKELKITDKRYIKRKKTFLEKISFLGNEFYLPWQDETAIYLPVSCGYFPNKEQNELYYYWIVAMIAQVDITKDNLLEENKKAQNYLINRYEGFNNFFKYANSYLLSQFKQFNNDDYPNPLWIYPSLNTNAKAIPNDDDEKPQANQTHVLATQKPTVQMVD